MAITIPERETLRDHAIGAMVRKALPFLTSVAFHGGLLGLGFLTYQSVNAIIHRQTQTTVPETPMLIEQVISDSKQGFGDRGRPQRPVHLNEPIQAGWNPEKRTSKGQLVTGEDKNPDGNTFVGVSSSLTSGLGLPGDMKGGTGSGPFGPGTGPGGSPNIFGPKAVRSAHSVAFLCDSSGSMLSKFDALKGELDKAIMSLRANQSFDIIFFGDNRSINLSPSLIMATPQNKVRATNFLEGIPPRGPTDPLPALELAFQQEPELIFVLTDGDFPDNDSVLKRIRELNRQKKVKINTIAFVSESDHDIAFINLLKQIAAENGGIYKHVAQSELQ